LPSPSEQNLPAPRPRIRSNAGWAFVAQFSKLLIQMGYFVILARTLKPTEYGAFVSVTALSGALSAFSGIGSGHLLVREISRDRSAFPRSWGLALAMHAISGIVLIGLLLGLSPWLLPAADGLPLVFAVAAADLIFARLLDLCFQAFQAVHDARQIVLITMTGSGARLAAALYFALLSPHKDAATWGWLYLIASIFAGILSVALVSSKIGKPIFTRTKLRPVLIDGFHFATSRSAETIYNDIDKAMLGRMSTLDATAIYSVAYRFVEAATVPITALATATYPIFFERGVKGVAGTYSFAKTLLPRSIAYGVFATVSLFVFSPLLQWLMGSSYHESTIALRWLCWLPLLRSVHAILLDVLTGADKQAVRSSVQWGVAIINILANLWLIPHMGWKGASISSILCDALLVIGLQACVIYFLKRSTEAPAVASPTLSPE
jgi:O-antigen/teichoic acid export membrane protein